MGGNGIKIGGGINIGKIKTPKISTINIKGIQINTKKPQQKNNFKMAGNSILKNCIRIGGYKPKR